MNQTSLRHKSELSRTLFPFESTNNINIKWTHTELSVAGYDCIYEEGISLMNACWVSQLVFNQALNAVQTVMMCLKENV